MCICKMITWFIFVTYSLHYIPDYRDYALCCVFQAVIKPTRTLSRKLPSIVQAQIDVCCITSSYTEFTEKIKALREDYLSKGVQFRPRIYAIGDSQRLESLYVVTGKFDYRLPSFIRCVDVIIKLKYVLGYDFMERCETFWCFITRYFYNHDYARKSKQNQLLQLIAYLERE